ncbi:MAG TPA: carbamoyltransferase [Micromonosporaceae bacterium]|nr:carbamoyltransferase [Micromonosporaceae bacterium]
MGAPTIGLNFGTHDAAAAIVIDGAVVAAAEEERFTRAKQTKVFPTRAIEYCLSEAGIDIADVDDVAFFVDPTLQLLMPLFNWYHGFPASLGSMASDLNKYHKRRRELAAIRTAGRLRRTTTITPVRHHLAHAASAYLTSPFDESLVVTIDGRGEYETAAIFEGRNGRLRLRHSVTYPHSIGYLYSMATRYLGFRPQRDEYKVMGLAGYGGNSFYERVAKLATFDDRTGRLRLNLSYFDHHRRPSSDRKLFSNELASLLGRPRLPDEPISDRHREIASAIQHLTEDLVSRYVLFAQRLVPSRSLCLAGGVALNGVANAKVIESGRFDSVYVQPAANDAGASLGAALAVASQRVASPVRRSMTNAFLGPAFDDAEIEKALLAANLAGYSITTVPDRYKAAASLLARDLIVGWFQGRMEFGPRALGARSILANPSKASTTARVNALIKRREMFRPLAPAVMAEHAAEYFALHDAGRLVYPFMLATAQVLATQRDRIPAVVHVDGSARVQTVSARDNPIMWNVIEQFRQLTGLPVVLNTSFNGADEPIVCTPADAVRTFLACGLDALLIGDYLAIRREQKE